MFQISEYGQLNTHPLQYSLESAADDSEKDVIIWVSHIECQQLLADLILSFILAAKMCSLDRILCKRG